MTAPMVMPRRAPRVAVPLASAAFLVAVIVTTVVALTLVYPAHWTATVQVDCSSTSRIVQRASTPTTFYVSCNR